MNIIVRYCLNGDPQMSGSYHANTEGTSQWAYGDTVGEAVGNLLLKLPRPCNVTTIVFQKYDRDNQLIGTENL